MDSFSADFLSSSYSDLWENYRYIKENPSIKSWDHVVITASDERQARMYRLQIQQRIDRGFLPSSCNYLCIPDPDGKRVGSGGATLSVIRHIIDACGADAIEKQRVLLIHSGGDSRRIPQYSVCGKLFSPVPRLLPDGNVSTLFDEFFIQFSSMPERIGGGMLVLSGDVLLLFNPLQVRLENGGATAVSMKAPATKGSHHGVFLTGTDGQVLEFLHKLPVEELEKKGAVNTQGTVDIDTGVVWLSGGLVSKLSTLVMTEKGYKKYLNEETRLNFYGDFLYPLAREVDEKAYLCQSAEHQQNEALMACRKDLWQLLHGEPLFVAKPSPAQFLHFGTTEELRMLTTSSVDEYRQFGWRRHVLTYTASQSEGWASHASWLAPSVQVEGGSYIEDSYLDQGTVVGANSVVSSLDGRGFALHIHPDTAIHQIQLEDGSFCIRCYGVGDNPKQGLWFDKSITELLNASAIPLSAVFDGEEQSLWDARLFPVCKTREKALLWTQRIMDWIASGILVEEVREAWIASERMSLATSFQGADPHAFLSWQQGLETEIRAALFCRSIEADEPHEEAIRHLNDDDRLLRQLEQVLRSSESMALRPRLRLYKSISLLLPPGQSLAGRTGDEYEDMTYQVLSDEVFKHYSSPLIDRDFFSQPVGKSATVRLPVRINFGGGWSDTPPYCFDFGGTVLNAALTVAGERPVQARVEILEEPLVRCIWEDGGLSKEFTTLEPLLSYSDPKDPFALHKAALVACGVLQPGKGSLEEQLLPVGGGIELSTKVSIPKGSGLGASSILAGACAQAITEVLGIETDEESLCSLALCVEQLMSTGGGWQDQVGGVVSGIKLIQTKPGLQQKFAIRKLQLTEHTLHELQKRFVLVYTGQRRLARNILREVVGKVLTRDRRVIEILQEIQQLAVLMAYELEKGRVTEFATLLNRHWELSVELDGGTTNTCIEYIFSSCEDLIDGRFIGGAGGGGFLFMILKENRTKQELSDRLQTLFQDSGIAVWESEFWTGLC